MRLSRPEIEQALAVLEAKVPSLLADRDSFPRVFEDEVEQLLGRVSDRDSSFVLDELEAIVERSGYDA